MWWEGRARGEDSNRARPVGEGGPRGQHPSCGTNRQREFERRALALSRILAWRRSRDDQIVRVCADGCCSCPQAPHAENRQHGSTASSGTCASRHASERSEACLMHATGTHRTHRTHRTRLTAGDSGRRIAASAGTTTYLCLLQCTYRDARAALPSPLLGCCNAQKVVFHSRCPSCHTPSLKVERFPSGAVVSLRLSRSRLLSSLEVERCRWSGARRAAPRAGRLRSRAVGVGRPVAKNQPSTRAAGRDDKPHKSRVDMYTTNVK